MGRGRSARNRTRARTPRSSRAPETPAAREVIVAERFKLPPVLTGSTWGNVWQAAWERLRQQRGMTINSEGVVAPKLTNREAASIIDAMRAIAPTTERKFPLWYQFAAVVYGWDPENDKIDISSAQADRFYEPDAAVELFVALQTMVFDLDDERAGTEPRVELDQGAFDDRIFQGEVVSALRADGAKAQAIIPQCKDKKSGKKRFPRPPCDKDGKGPKGRDPITGVEIELPCDNPGDCEPIKPKRSIETLGWLIIAAGVVYLFAPAVLSGAIAGRVARNSRRGRRTRR